MNWAKLAAVLAALSAAASLGYWARGGEVWRLKAEQAQQDARREAQSRAIFLDAQSRERRLAATMADESADLLKRLENVENDKRNLLRDLRTAGGRVCFSDPPGGMPGPVPAASTGGSDGTPAGSVVYGSLPGLAELIADADKCREQLTAAQAILKAERDQGEKVEQDKK